MSCAGTARVSRTVEAERGRKPSVPSSMYCFCSLRGPYRYPCRRTAEQLEPSVPRNPASSTFVGLNCMEQLESLSGLPGPLDDPTSTRGLCLVGPFWAVRSGQFSDPPQPDHAPAPQMAFGWSGWRTFYLDWYDILSPAPQVWSRRMKRPPAGLSGVLPSRAASPARPRNRSAARLRSIPSISLAEL